MIGPRPTRGAGGAGAAAGRLGALTSDSRRKGAAPLGEKSRRPRSRSRSRSEKGDDQKKGGKEKESKKEKEFAWMDSDDESEKAEKAPASPPARSSASSSPEKEVPVHKVETLSQMARLAPTLEKRIRQKELRSRELCEVAAALGRAKYFDAGLFDVLAPELRRSCERNRLGPNDILEAICSLAELNAYNAELFEAACKALRADLQSLPEAQRQRLEQALKKVKHDPGENFWSEIRLSRRDKREACPMFWRGQCKWGSKCKLSHDQDSFDSKVARGTWRPPSSSGGKSVGFKQSADLFKEDRCGALW